MSRALKVRVFGLAVGIALVMTACGGGAEKETAASPTTAEQPASTEPAGTVDTAPPAETSGEGGEPLIVGMPIALTGPFSFIDAPVRGGVELAIEELNASGGILGRQLSLVTADTKSDQSLVPTVAQEVLGEGADFIVATADYDFGGPACRTAMEQDPPVICMSLAGDPRFGKEGIGPNSFNVYFGGPTEGAAIATYAFEQGWKRPYILEDTSIAYSQNTAKYFLDTWEQLAGEGTLAGRDVFLNADPSIAPQISAMRASDADFILVASYVPGGVTALRQIRDAGIDLPIVGGAGFDGAYWTADVPSESYSDLFVVGHGVTTPGRDPDPVRNAFFQRYYDRFGEPAALSVHSLGGYSTVQAWAIAAERAGTIDYEAVRAELEKFSNEPLTVGPMTWTPDCHIPYGAPGVVVTFDENGEQVFVADVEPKEVAEAPC